MCVPSSTLGAFMLRWMLVFEMRDSDTLWLLKAAPRRFFPNASQALSASRASAAAGEAGFIEVVGAPTRFGEVSYTVDAVQAAGGLEARPDALQLRLNVSLALHGRGAVQSAVPGGGGLTLVVRLRDPAGTRRLSHATLHAAGGEGSTVALGAVDAEGETVSVSVGAGGVPQAVPGEARQARLTSFTVLATLTAPIDEE